MIPWMGHKLHGVLLPCNCSLLEDIVLKIENRELEVGSILGEGGFGVVKKGTWKTRQAEVAIKTFLTKEKFTSEVSY